MNQLADSLVANQIALRSIIQYEVLHKKPIVESYIHFCTIVGNDAMNFSDFEFWFIRFSNGHLDVNYERPLDPVPVLSLLTLPVEMIGKIVEKLDPISRIFTRHVSKRLRSVIDDQISKIREVKCSYWRYGFYASFDGLEMTFRKEGNDTTISYGDIQLTAKGTCFVKLAFNEIDRVLKQSTPVKLFIDSDLNQNVGEFELQKSTWNVDLLFIETSSQVVGCHILELIKPTSLKSITLSNWGADVNFGNILEMEQWKNARSVDLCYFGLLNSTDFEEVLKFPVFKCKAELNQLTDLVNLRNKLRKMPTFKYCVIVAENSFNCDQVADALGAAVHRDRLIRDPIPGSDDFLEICLLPNICIRRKRR